VRLAFALVTAVQPELLIIDEALSVGDQHFQKKCVQRIEEFRSNGCTILFCSHSLYHVRQLCDQVLWLDHGKMRGLGDTEAVLSNYETHVRLQEGAKTLPGELGMANEKTQPLPPTALVEGQRACLLKVEVEGTESGSSTVLSGPDLRISVQAMTREQEEPSIGVMLEQYQGVGITSVATHAEGITPAKLDTNNGRTTWQIILTFPQLPLHSGQYTLSFYLFDAQGLVVYDEWKDFIQFQWLSKSLTPGLVRLPHLWS
jgi:lipopolysaccharide transport system ATP-binding protein